MRTPTDSDRLLEQILTESRAALEAQLDEQLLRVYAVRWHWDGAKLVATPVTAEEFHDGGP